MHDPVRDAAQQESLKCLPPMGTDHDEVVALSRFTHGCHRITYSDIGRYGELWTGQRLGRILHDLFGLPLTLLRPIFESHHQMRVDQMQRGDDREDGDCNGVLEGVRRQPCLQTDRILASFHRHEDAVDRASFSFHDLGRYRGMEQDTVRHTACKQFHHPAVIVRADSDEVGLYCGGAVENEGGWVLDFA